MSGQAQSLAIGVGFGVTEALRPEDPRRAGRYELLGRLGSGGMGQVFLGRSPGGRVVAVKIIKAGLLAANPDFRARFAREVESARRVNALFTAPVVDADPDAEVPWLVTAYVPGPSLDDAVAGQGPLPAGVVRALGAGLAEGLAAIHSAGVVHRDLKPSNVLLAGDGPRIIDFGISRAAEASVLTMTGAFVGTPAFMSPEQADGRPAGPPSDIFSLGSVLTFAATGHGPFQAASIPALFYQVVNAEPVLTAVPDALRPLLARCLDKAPERRPTPLEVMDELGPAGLLQNWLPQAVAATLARYDLQHVAVLTPPAAPSTAAPPGAGQQGLAPQGVAQQGLPTQGQATAPANTARPAAQSGQQPSPSYGAYGPQPYAFGQPYQVRTAPPARSPRPYRPPPAVFQSTGTGASHRLPAEYRFGWLALPALFFLAVAAFVAPLEIYTALTWGFIIVVVVSRLAGAVIRVRARGPAGIGGAAVRCVISDIGGAIGLALLAFGALALTVDVLLPTFGPGSPQAYRSALNVSGPASPFATTEQAAYFLHFFLLLPALAVGVVVLMRARASLARPLVLPRAARYVNTQPMPVRLGIAGAVTALSLMLVALNGGLAAGRLPSGAICVIARQTCASAAKIRSSR